MYRHLCFYVSFHVNYSLRHCPEFPTYEFQKAFLEIFSYILCSLFFLVYLLCLFWWLLVIGGFIIFPSFMNHLKPEEHSSLFLLVTYSWNNFLTLSVKVFWSTLKHMAVTTFKDSGIRSKHYPLLREPSLCWYMSYKTISLHKTISCYIDQIIFLDT